MNQRLARLVAEQKTVVDEVLDWALELLEERDQALERIAA